MAEFFRTSTIWVVDFRFDGRARRWFRAYRAGHDPRAEVETELRELHGGRAVLVALREATPDEEAQYLRGDAPGNVYCPTGR